MTPEHYYAEMMVERQRRNAGQTLPLRFWEHPTLGPEYGRQVAAARMLLKSVDTRSVAKALQTPEGKKVFSLGARWVIDLCKAEQARQKKEQLCVPTRPVAIPDPVGPLPNSRPVFVPKGKKSLITKLKECDQKGTSVSLVV